VQRLYGVLDTRLARDEYLAGEFSIADIACFPWTRVAAGHGADIKADFPHVARWMSAIGQRPSAKVRIDDPREARASKNEYTAEQFQTLFRPAAGTVGPPAGEVKPDGKETSA
jgi:GST-like protein